MMIDKDLGGIEIGTQNESNGRKYFEHYTDDQLRNYIHHPVHETIFILISILNYK